MLPLELSVPYKLGIWSTLFFNSFPCLTFLYLEEFLELYPLGEGFNPFLATIYSCDILSILSTVYVNLDRVCRGTPILSWITIRFASWAMRATLLGGITKLSLLGTYFSIISKKTET